MHFNCFFAENLQEKMDDNAKTRAKKIHDFSFKSIPSSSGNSSISVSRGASFDSTISSLSFESISTNSSLDYTTYETQSQHVPIVEKVLNTEEIVDQMNERINEVSNVLNVSIDGFLFVDRC